MSTATANISRLSLLGLLIATACGPAPFKPTKRITIQPSSYTYEYNDQGCKTGKHTFSTKDEYCQGLMNDELNQYCAQSEREAAYNQQCR